MLNISWHDLSIGQRTWIQLIIQVNLFWKLLILHQLTHNMTTYCSLNYNSIREISKLRTWGEQVVQKLILTFRRIYVHNMFFPCSAKRRSSDKDLPVPYSFEKFLSISSFKWWKCFVFFEIWSFLSTLIIAH